MSTRRPEPSAPLPPPDALHVPFSFLRASLKDDRDAQFVATTMNIARGISLCLELAIKSNLVREMNEQVVPEGQEAPLLNLQDTDRLMHFALESARLLDDYAEDRIQWLNTYRVTEGK
ncbi:hypothetical protein ACL9RI_07940 [Janthinobacterium sp. Mn2066]|uniref:hypothetical protein n=1 Tax=Janthinobacterium sp. Mn2066 TaxID=3395264 RepID=UPI003BC1839E